MTWAKKPTDSEKLTINEIVTQRIMDKLQAGIIPWRRPWSSNGQAVNWNSQRAYTGINTLLLEPGEYATFPQIEAAGGKVKKGSKASIVVFWKWPDKSVETESDEGEAGPRRPYMRYYNVFNVLTQCEGLTSRRKSETFVNDPIQAAEKIKEGYRTCPAISFAPGRAYYRPSADTISIPAITDYRKPQEYYCTMFHEMIHSTGHKIRLDREGVQGIAAFGSETYSKEELIAELGAAMLCTEAGIDNDTIDNSAAYIQSWLRALKNDTSLIVKASSSAKKASDYILGVTS